MAPVMSCVYDLPIFCTFGFIDMLWHHLTSTTKLLFVRLVEIVLLEPDQFNLKQVPCPASIVLQGCSQLLHSGWQDLQRESASSRDAEREPMNQLQRSTTSIRVHQTCALSMNVLLVFALFLQPKSKTAGHRGMYLAHPTKCSKALSLMKSCCPIEASRHSGRSHVHTSPPLENC